jgi:hypothetical protein
MMILEAMRACREGCCRVFAAVFFGKVDGGMENRIRAPLFSIVYDYDYTRKEREWRHC